MQLFWAASCCCENKSHVCWNRFAHATYRNWDKSVVTGVQGGTRRGLRNLLTSLDKVLWEGATWKCTSLADVSTDVQAHTSLPMLLVRRAVV